MTSRFRLRDVSLNTQNLPAYGPNTNYLHKTLQRVRLANRGRLLLRTPGPVLFWTCIRSNVETILSWTYHVYGPFEFRTSLGTSILLVLTIPFQKLILLYKNMSIRGSYSAIWSVPLTNVKWHSDPRPTVTSQPIRLSTNLMTFIPSLTFTDYEWFPWSNGCGMPAGNAYPSGHLVPSPIVRLACAPNVETRFLELARSPSFSLYSTFHLEYPLVLSRFCFIIIIIERGFFSYYPQCCKGMARHTLMGFQVPTLRL